MSKTRDYTSFILIYYSSNTTIFNSYCNDKLHYNKYMLFIKVGSTQTLYECTIFGKNCSLMQFRQFYNPKEVCEVI